MLVSPRQHLSATATPGRSGGMSVMDGNEFPHAGVCVYVRACVRVCVCVCVRVRVYVYVYVVWR